MVAQECIHLVFNIDDRYVMPVAVALRSAAENLPAPHCLHATILTEFVSYENKHRLERSLSGFPVTVTWSETRLPEDTFTLGSHPGGVAATYLKLLVGQHVPENVTRVIYLDADVVVCKNLIDLWHIPLNGMMLAAVADSRWQCERMARLGIPAVDFSQDGSYFNAGVMVIDMVAWRAGDIFNRAVRFANTYRDQLYIVDQDLLNCLVGGNYKRLDPSWNLLEFYGAAYRPYWNRIAPAMYSQAMLDTANLSPAIMHYSGFPKPWEKACAAHDPAIFLNVYARTDWQSVPLTHYQAALTRRNRLYRETVAIMKVFYRELELGRIHGAVFGDWLLHLWKNWQALVFLPGILCRNGYWAFRAYAVPRRTARQKRKKNQGKLLPITKVYEPR